MAVCGVEPEEGILQILLTGCVKNLGKRSFADLAAFDDDADAVAELLCFPHDVGGDEHQLAGFLRRYKGMAPRPEASDPKTIDLEGDFNQWNNVLPAFKDYICEMRARNSKGAPKGTMYTNNSGRNDFEEMKVTFDNDNIYFYVKTYGYISSRTGTNWMLLYIDSDRDKKTGWEGYDYALNMEVLSDNATTLKERKDDSWETVCECSYRLKGEEMMICVPRKALGLDGGKPSFYFHWMDNSYKLDDISEFFIHGDSAPERRYNYWYEPK